MKNVFVLAFILLTGCIGDAALPIVSSTPIPGTQLKVHLGGPAKNGRFGYYITSSNGMHYGYRDLGPLTAEQTTPVNLDRVGDGVFRIQWGDSNNKQYAVIDIEKKRFVEDSNSANPKNESFAEN